MSVLTHSFFSKPLLAWYAHHGRHDLPWQGGDPYAVWLSEIMLQQTQVTTVIDYYKRFIKELPTVAALAAAPIDQILHLWTGLGYYARARNLHAAAQQIMSQHQGQFPQTLQALMALPGIGRSTAGAILAQAFDHRAVILDGNVKRVLCRFYAIQRWPGERETEQLLWRLAENLTPVKRTADYTQAIMDLGATVCRRRQPLCEQCPVQAGCMARQQNEMGYYPVARPKKAQPARQVIMPLICDGEGRVLLCQRPPVGIWGGLWSLPECPVTENLPRWLAAEFSLDVEIKAKWPPMRHTFSHFHLDIEPVVAKLTSCLPQARESSAQHWLDVNKSMDRGLPRPVEKLLQQYREYGK